MDDKEKNKSLFDLQRNDWCKISLCRLRILTSTLLLSSVTLPSNTFLSASKLLIYHPQSNTEINISQCLSCTLIFGRRMIFLLTYPLLHFFDTILCFQLLSDSVDHTVCVCRVRLLPNNSHRACHPTPATATEKDSPGIIQRLICIDGHIDFIL